MKKSIVLIALVCVMVFAFASIAMADHSPQFYFNWQAGTGVTSSPTFQAVFPTAAGLTFSIDNGSYALGTASPHKGYSQTTAKCGVCHSVHRAPTLGTGSTAAPTTSSRYALNRLHHDRHRRHSAATEVHRSDACAYCHISSGYHLMYGGDATMAWTTSADAEYSWNEFYGHTSNCVQCHAVHGAYTLPGSKILKYQGVKASSTFELQVQPEVYTNSPLWASKADMLAGTLKPAAIADGVTLEDASVTAHCSICHANYSPDNNTMINNDLPTCSSSRAARGRTPTASRRAVGSWCQRGYVEQHVLHEVQEPPDEERRRALHQPWRHGQRDRRFCVGCRQLHLPELPQRSRRISWTACTSSSRSRTTRLATTSSWQPRIRRRSPRRQTVADVELRPYSVL